jgi:hypothetical protein
MTGEMSVTTTGSGAIGTLETGWSVQEFATPVNPNERAGGTGIVNFAGPDAGEGVLLINNESTATTSELGSVSGIIRTVTQQGQRITCTQDTLLSRYDATRTMPPMIAGSPPAALELAEQVLGTNLCSKASGVFWSLNGHGVGFDANGNVAEAQTGTFSIPYTDGDTSRVANYTPRWFYVNASSPTTVSGSGKIWMQSIAGSNFSPAPNAIVPLSGLSRLACKIRVSNGNNWSMYFSGGPESSNEGTGFYVTVTVDWSADTISYTGESLSGGLLTVISGSASIATLDRDAELALFLDYGKSDGRAQLNVKVCNTSNYSTVVSLLVDTATSTQIAGPWQITGRTRALWMDYDTNFTNQTPAEWEVASPVTIPSATLGQPVIGWRGTIWEWLQHACAVNYGDGANWELALVDDAIVLRRSGNIILDLGNYEGAPTITPTSVQAGRQIDIAYGNATATAEIISYDATGAGLPLTYDATTSSEVYDALEDDNRIISVGAAETVTTTVQTNAYLTAILQPTRTTSFIPGEGTYYLIDSTGLPIVAEQWEDYGGSVSVAINPDNAGAIDVTMIGPREEIPSTTSPYSMAVSDGQNQYAALSILGSGVVADPKTLNLLTGADPAKVKQEVAFSVNNPFINTLAQAYDSGMWASLDGSGPRVGLSLAIPTADLNGFGLVAGSIIHYADCDYRVMSAGIGRLKAQLECVRHVTVGAFDDAWAGETVGDHDTAWDGYLCEDQVILPYKSTPEATLGPPISPP